MPINGNLSKWLLGALLAVVMTLVGIITSWTDNRITHVEDACDAQLITEIQHAQRLSALEAQYAEILRRLERIDGKLD